jgi:hypothetical protein
MGTARSSAALVSFVVALTLVAQDGVAQGRPDFSGTWVRADSADQRPSVAATGDAGFRTGDMGSGWGSPVTITQTADSLIVEYVFFATYDLQPPLRFAYAFDASETRHAVMIGHATYIQRSRLGWNDRDLVITTLHPLPPEVMSARGSLYFRTTITLVSPASLVVSTTRQNASDAGPGSVTRTVYTRR